MLDLEALTYGSLSYGSPDVAGLKWSLIPDPSAADALLRPLTLTVTNTGALWRGILRLRCGFGPAEDPYFLLPGYMVGTNRGDAPLKTDSKTPRLWRSPADFPASPWWMARGDRLSHPVAMIYAGHRALGLCGSPTFTHHGSMQFAGFGCDIDRGCVYYTIGWENAPWLFIESHHYTPREILPQQCITLEPGETITLHLYDIDFPGEDVRCVHRVVRAVYDRFHESPRKGAELPEAVRLLAGAVDTDAWMEDAKAYAGFVFDRGDHMEYRPLPSTTWTNGLAVATPMLMASHYLKSEPMRAHALTFIQNVVDNSLNPASGLPWTVCDRGVWSNRGWWYDQLPVPGHTGYLVGQTLYGILRAYDAERSSAGIVHEDWLDFVRRVLVRLESTPNSDGEYPYVLSEETGAGLCYDAMSGVWCLAAAAYARVLTGETGDLSRLLRSESYYYHHYVAKVCCYGGPLDIDKQVDSEGVLAYIRAVRRLHSLTHDPVLLEHMRDALLYEFTFKFCYNTPVSVPPLSRGWSSCGGSVTSVTNPHIHPMSSGIMDEMSYYLSQTDDPYIRSRLNDTMAWSLQTFSRFDGEYDYGKAGWMSERFCYSQGLLKERYPDGSLASTWFALMPWAVGCLLEGFCGDCRHE